MRTYTLVLSIVAHVLAILVIVATTLTATGALPAPTRAIEFLVAPADVPAVPPPAPRRTVMPVGISREAVRDDRLDAVPVNGAVVSGDAFGAPIHDEVPPPPPPAVSTPPIHVGGAVSQPRRTHYVVPQYPAIAREAHVSGIVILDAVIAEDGSVRDVHVLRSIPLLDEAASDAVRQWRFTPTLLNGQPVPVVMTVTVAFDLR
jgi:protein TonB